MRSVRIREISRSALAATLVVLATGAAALARQQPPRYVERVEVARVLIDARVVDDLGQPVRDLGVGDFEVRIGGKAARLESVQWVSGEAGEDLLPLDSSEFRTSYDPLQGRLIVFLFQKSLERSRIVGFMRMLIEARGFLDTLGPRDRVAVLSFDSRLQIWVDFTNDFERIRRVFERGILFESATAFQESAYPSLVARLDPARASKTYTIEKALRLIGQALEDLPGAKSIVLVGHGFGRFGATGVSMENEYEATADALQAARASVFCLDVTNADYHSLEAGLQIVAADTGGFFARTHLFHKRALDLLSGALAGYYVLFVEKPDLGRGAHGIEVKLTRRKGNVLAKRSYIATASRAPATAEEVVPGAPPARASCSVTMPPDPAFVPPAPYPRHAPEPGTFWYGTPALWTMLSRDGTWRSLPRGEAGYRQKVFLWRPGYDGRSEQWPDVKITARRLDGDAPPSVTESATNAYRRDFGGWSMLAGVEVPTPGCWELTAAHGGATVTFTVRLLP